VLAHAGHILIDLPLYGGPVIMVAGALGISSLRSRRGDRGRAR